MTRLRPAPKLSDVEVPGRTVAMAVRESAAGVDGGGGAAGDDRGASAVVVDATVGLPDIGDPFDVEAFRSITIPDDRNAFVLYRQAADRLRP